MRVLVGKTQVLKTQTNEVGVKGSPEVKIICYLQIITNRSLILTNNKKKNAFQT